MSKKKKNHVFPKKQTEIIVFFSFSFLTYCSATNEKPKTKATLKNRGIIRVNMRLELPKHVVATVHSIRSGGPTDESWERPTWVTQTSKAVEAPLSTAGGSGRERETQIWGSRSEKRKEKREKWRSTRIASVSKLWTFGLHERLISIPALPFFFPYSPKAKILSH